VQPAGPYRLAGYSFGAHVAYEMASRLVGLGDEVAYLGIIDTWPARQERNVVRRILQRALDLAAKVPARAAMAWRARDHVARGLTGLASDVLRPGKRAMTIGEHLESILLAMHHHGRADMPGSLAPQDADESAQVRTTRKIASDKRAIAAYKMTPIPALVGVFASGFEKTPGRRRALEAQWRMLAGGGLRVHWFECGHGDLLRPPVVNGVARAIGEDLARPDPVK
jgi:thioesterase domain-containing protein